MTTVGQKVKLRGGADGIYQPLAQFLPQEAQHTAQALQRKAPPSQVAQHCYLGHVVERVQALVAAALRDHDAALVPPLQLAQADAGARCHFRRGEGLLLHLSVRNRRLLKCLTHHSAALCTVNVNCCST